VRHPFWIRIRPTLASGRQAPGPVGHLVPLTRTPSTPIRSTDPRHARHSGHAKPMREGQSDRQAAVAASWYTTMRGSRRPARTMPAVMIDACGPKSPDSHRVVWGLTSRPPVSPCGLSSGFPFARRVPPLSPAFLWFPVVRRSPVRLLRPLPGFRFPFGSPPGSLLRATLMLALPRGDSAGVGPGRQGPRSPVPPRPLAWIARSARTTYMSSIRRRLAPRPCRCRADHRVH
jgi:hypothetical protein